MFQEWNVNFVSPLSWGKIQKRSEFGVCLASSISCPSSLDDGSVEAYMIWMNSDSLPIKNIIEKDLVLASDRLPFGIGCQRIWNWRTTVPYVTWVRQNLDTSTLSSFSILAISWNLVRVGFERRLVPIRETLNNEGYLSLCKTLRKTCTSFLLHPFVISSSNNIHRVEVEMKRTDSKLCEL